MTAPKKPAKKAAAKKTAAAPPQEPTVGGTAKVEASGSVGTTEPETTPEPEPAPVESRLGAFPLEEGHYFHPQVVARSAHYGESETDRSSLRALQNLLGAPTTGVYDAETERLVAAWKEARGLTASPIVDAETWQRISEGT